MELKSAALMGAGAVGAYFIWGLSKQLGENFCVVAEGERAERLKRDGLEINGEHFSLNVKSPEEARGVDLLLVSTKYAALRSALPSIKAMTDGTDTVVMSLLNGIDSEEILAEQIDPSRILNAFMLISSERAGESIRFNPSVTKGLIFGEKGKSEKTEICAAVESLLSRGTVNYTWVPNIIEREWGKFARNIAYNIPQAILAVGIGAFEDSSHVLFISRQLEEEVHKTAAAYGIHLPPIDRNFTAGAKKNRYSTLQDLDSHRHTEIDMFCGVLIKKAAERNVPVPAATLCFHLIKALEEKNDGKFNYQ